jgi:hypothetical protein
MAPDPKPEPKPEYTDPWKDESSYLELRYENDVDRAGVPRIPKSIKRIRERRAIEISTQAQMDDMVSYLGQSGDANTERPDQPSDIEICIRDSWTPTMEQIDKLLTLVPNVTGLDLTVRRWPWKREPSSGLNCSLTLPRLPRLGSCR